MKNAFDVVRDFEEALCEYTGAPYCVTTTSCTDALGICFDYHRHINLKATGIILPSRTYVGVPMQAKRAGYHLNFEDYTWSGMYRIQPLRVWDAARRFNRDMFQLTGYPNGSEPNFMCLSFHYTKILSLTQGGCILHDSPKFDEYARKARFDGRSEGEPAGNWAQYDILGRHAYMGPEVAALGLRKLMAAKDYNDDLPMDNYPDCSKIEVFK